MRTGFTRMTKSKAVFGLICVVVLASIVLFYSESGLTKVKPKQQEPKKTFSITGQIAGLFPGADREMALTITNPHSFEIIVTRIDVEVQGVDQLGCPKSDVIGGTFPVNLIIGKKGTVMTTVPISMVADSDNDCQGARFTIRYDGEAVKK